MLKKRRNFRTTDKEDGFICFVLLLFLSGCVAGSILASRFFLLVSDNYLLNNGFAIYGVVSFFQSFISTGVILCVLFFAGFCAVGQPISFCTALYRGVVLGLAVGSSYMMGGISVLPAVAVFSIPHAVATTIILAYAIRESVGFSNLLATCCVSEKTECGLRGRFKKYLLRFLVLTIFTVICAAIRTVLFMMFYKTLVAL